MTIIYYDNRPIYEMSANHNEQLSNCDHPPYTIAINGVKV